VNELCKLPRLDPDLADNEGNTPLHHAAQAGWLIFSLFINFALVKLLRTATEEKVRVE